MQTSTLIVGGGIAGMSAALRLLDAGHTFTLVTDELGGRVMYSPEAKVNYGAYFLMSNYRFARRILTPGALISPTGAMFHNSSQERFPLIHPHTLTRLPELLRFLGVMFEFRSHYEPYKVRCLTIPQKAALAADPYLERLFHLSASEFIKEKGLERVAYDYTSKFAYACTGVGLDCLTAFDLLNVDMGLITPIRHFRFDRDAFERKLGDRLVMDTITRVEGQAGSYWLEGRSGRDYCARNVILATPACITRQLLHLAKIREACQLYVWHLKATLKPIYRRYELNLFPPTSEIMLTARQWDGTYLVYSIRPQPDLGIVCEQYQLLRQIAWEQAMYVHGDAYVEQAHAPGLYVAGDHNGLGLEPSAISGIYAANQVLGRSGQ